MKSPSFNILWASQTGNAEWIAQNIYKEASKHGYECEKCLVFDEYEQIDLVKAGVVVFVTSNTGDGDPPDNGLKFMRYIRRIKDANFLSNVNVAVLGLGDTNYSNFNNTGRRLEKKLIELGGTVFYEKGLADDGTGLEEVVDPWIAGLWTALESVCEREVVETTGAANRVSSSLPPKKKDTVSDEQVDDVVSKYLTPATGDVKLNGSVTTSTTTTTTEAITTTAPPRPTPPPARNIPSHILKRLNLSSAYVSPATSTGYTLPLDYQALAIATQLTGIPKLSQTTLTIQKSEEEFRRNFPDYLQPTPTSTKIVAHRRLSSEKALKKTLHVELDAKNMQDVWSPGDAFGLFAPNNDKHVVAILAHLGYTSTSVHQKIVLSGDVPSYLAPSGRSTSAYELVKWSVDLSGTLRKALLRVLAEFASDAEEKKKLLFICSKQGSATFSELREFRPTLADIFATFPSSKPPLERLLVVLPALAPRYYSIANDPVEKILHIAFNVVEYEQHLGTTKASRKGIATPYIQESIVEERHLHIFKKASALIPFQLPQDGGRNVLLIGPGTGISPFVGFLQLESRRRKEGQEPNKIWVLSGCRRKQDDWIYGEELKQFEKDGICSRLDVCESRPGNGDLVPSKSATGQYVQDFLVDHASDVVSFLFSDDSSHIYLCGDAKGMAQGVHEALVTILGTTGKDKIGANELLSEWMENGRYLRDVWG